MNELPSIEDRVSKGIAWLEEQGAYDWAEKIVAAVDAAKFEMDNCFQCAVGTTLGSYVRDFHYPIEATGVDAVAEAIRHGFFAKSKRSYGRLEAVWERRARAHAAYRAEVLGDA